MRETPGRFFMLPIELYSLGLSCGAIAVYSYLVYCEDRKTYQCHVSYKTIGKRIGMTENTVRKYVRELEDKQFIYKDGTAMPTFIDSKRRRELIKKKLAQGHKADDHEDEQYWQRM